MAVILENRSLGEEMYLLRAQYEGKAEPGQFFMLRSAGSFPLLSRPLSIFDVQDDSITFLYKVIGEGTKEFSRLSQGMELELYGPFGKGFDLIPEGRNVALVGGGMGTAPLFYTAKRIRELSPDKEITLYLGFQKESAVVDVFKELNLPLIFNFGGYVSEEVDYEKHDVIYTCGPEVMMRRVSHNGKEFGKPVFVSLEKHMACGVGACLGCTCKTKEGNKRVCKEGPVFPGEEVFYE